MDRRGFLTTSAAASVGVAGAGTGTAWLAAPSEPPPSAASGLKGGGRALIAEPIPSVDLGGALPFALARVALPASLIAGAPVGPDGLTRSLSPVRDVVLRGFAAGANALASDRLTVDAVVATADGASARHMLWSHAPAQFGGTSPGVAFTAHEDAFAGFEVTFLAASTGKRSSALFNFAASGAGPQLNPGVYVLAGPRAATGRAPDLGDYGFTGDLAAPLRPSQLVGLDFSYLTFAVYGEWA